MAREHHYINIVSPNFLIRAFCSQIYQVTQALKYMHQKNPPIIHGDLKAVSVPWISYLNDSLMRRIRTIFSYHMTVLRTSQTLDYQEHTPCHQVQRPPLTATKLRIFLRRSTATNLDGVHQRSCWPKISPKRRDIGHPPRIFILLQGLCLRYGLRSTLSV